MEKLFKEFDKNLRILKKNKELQKDEKIYYEFMRDFKNILYTDIHENLAPKKNFGNNEKTIRSYVKYVIVNLLPLAEQKIIQFTKETNGLKSNVGNKLEMLNNWINLEDDLYALASYRSLKHFAYYIERGQHKKVWKHTMHLFESYFYYASRMILNDDVDKIRSSYFPGAGKTYSGNVTCAFWFGVDEEISILRITYSDDLAKSFTNQTKQIVESEHYRKVFPKFDLEPKDLYKVSNAGVIWFSFANTTNLYATTRDGQTTGKRAKVIMIDDITKGANEAYNTDIHKKYVNAYDNDWSTRGDDDDQKLILMGTMWSPYDLLNIVQKRAEKYARLILDTNKNHKYTLVDNEDNKLVKNIFISVPILDYETDESTCPSRYSTEKMRQRREDADDKSLFNAVYQQRPEAPNELALDWNYLKQYQELPQKIQDGDCQAVCFIDPNRKTGRDYFSMPICKRYKLEDDTWSKLYLVDWIFKRDTYKNLSNRVCERIVHHRMNKTGVECNTSTDMGDLLLLHLESFNYYDLEIDEVYSTEKKEVKIMNGISPIIKEIIFPNRHIFSETSEVGQALIQLTTYDTVGKNKNDDAVDSLIMLVKQFCENDVENDFRILSNNFRL